MKINNKLIPVSDYKRIDHSSNLSGGWIDYFEYGDMVVAYIQDLTTSTNITANNTTLFSGLPKAKKTIYFELFRYYTTTSTDSTTHRAKITTNGDILTHYSNIYSGNNQYYGMVVYLKTTD